MLLISLVGEQPIPILLPIKHLRATRVILVYTADTDRVAQHLQKILPHAMLLKVQPYDLSAILARLQDTTAGEPDVVFNLTGGTKPMALAAFALAARNHSPFVYLQSQGHTSLLFRYRFEEGLPILAERETLPALITAEEYLHAHLPGFRIEGFSKDARGQITDGGRFERAIHDALTRREFEVLAGVRPEGVADQIEIDLVIRAGNQIGIAEVKLADVEGHGPKAGLDQLAMAAGREYLGTYTVKFLITARRQNARIATLARERGIHIIELPTYRDAGRLTLAEGDQLERSLCAKLGTDRQGRS